MFNKMHVTGAILYIVLLNITLLVIIMLMTYKEKKEKEIIECNVN